MENEKMELDMETLKKIRIGGKSVIARTICPICYISHKTVGVPSWIFLHRLPLCFMCAEEYVPGLLKIVDHINNYNPRKSEKLYDVMIQSLYLFTVWYLRPPLIKDLFDYNQTYNEHIARLDEISAHYLKKEKQEKKRIK